jgi:hypothetical protein
MCGTHQSAAVSPCSHWPIWAASDRCASIKLYHSDSPFVPSRHAASSPVRAPLHHVLHHHGGHHLMPSVPPLQVATALSFPSLSRARWSELPNHTVLCCLPQPVSTVAALPRPISSTPRSRVTAVGVRSPSRYSFRAAGVCCAAIAPSPCRARARQSTCASARGPPCGMGCSPEQASPPGLVALGRNGANGPCGTVSLGRRCRFGPLRLVSFSE